MVDISLSEEIKRCCPRLRLGCLEANVLVSESPDDLKCEIDEQATKISQTLTVEKISSVPVIAASRQAYKACGKDPARYRLSAEALLRRVVSGKGLYHINNVVDQLNLVSIVTGFSIGGYDAGRIQGNITLGIGRANEPYRGLGRGELNIENLPVFRDDLGAFGTPTSDSERTGVTEETSRFLMVLLDFGSDPALGDALQMAGRLLAGHCHAQSIETKFFE